MRRKLIEGRPRIYDYMDGAVVREIVQQHLEGRENRRLFIWSLLNVEQVLQAA